MSNARNGARCSHGAWWYADCEPCAEEDVREECAVEMARLQNVEHMAMGFVEAVEAMVEEHERSPGGMRVPFHGDFVGAHKLPSVYSRLRWWAREIRGAVEKQEAK